MCAVIIIQGFTITLIAYRNINNPHLLLIAILTLVSFKFNMFGMDILPINYKETGYKY